MDVVEAYVTYFNAKDFDRLEGLFAPGYSYAEPLYPQVRDAAQHIALMKAIAEKFPDRRVKSQRRYPGAAGVAVAATWSGSAVSGGRRLTLDMVFAFDIDETTGLITRMRSYYSLPRL
jgi:ketosteroid isomerase-like protein